MNCSQIFFTVLHVMWHSAFLLANISAVIIGCIHREKCSTFLLYWMFSYGIACLSYYLVALLSAVVTFIEGQDIESQNKSLFQMIRIIQDELGMEVRDDADFHEISINLSPAGQSRMRRRYLLNVLFGMVILCALSSGCMILGMTPWLDCNLDVYTVSFMLIMMTCIKMCIYIVYAVVH